MTEWPQFAELALDPSLAGRMATPLVIDGRNVLDPEKVRAAGLVYEGVGRGLPSPVLAPAPITG